MKKSCYYYLILLTCLIMLPVNVVAQDDGWGPGQDKWKFNLGGFFPSSDVELKINGVDPGDLIDLEDVLGFDDSDNLWRLDGYWRFFKRHRLVFGYYQFNRDASLGLSEEIKIGDEVFPVDALVSSELDLGFYTIDYMYSLYQGEKAEISGGLGVYWVDATFHEQGARVRSGICRYHQLRTGGTPQNHPCSVHGCAVFHEHGGRV